MKTIKLLPMAMLLMAMNVFAEGGVGNGGFVYNCGDSLALIDLKEVEHLPSLNGRIKILKESLPYQTQIAKKVALIKTINAEVGSKVEKAIIDIEKKLELRSAIDTSLPDDLGYVPHVDGCEITNVIQYSQNILTNIELYKKLDHANKAALLVHEALYFVARDANIRYYRDMWTSVPVRRLVAMLFSENFNELKNDFSELLNFYLVENSREIPKTIKVVLCMDKKFVGERKDLVQLSEKSLKKVKFILEQKDSWGEVTPSPKQEIKGETFIKVPQRCDGSVGESFVAESKEIYFPKSIPFVVEYKPKQSHLFEKSLDATISLKIMNGSVEELVVLERNVSASAERYDLLTPSLTTIFDKTIKTQSRPMTDTIRGYVEAQ